jgi:hypothetical protein
MKFFSRFPLLILLWVDSVFAQNNISIFEASNLMLQSNMPTVVLFSS